MPAIRICVGNRQGGVGKSTVVMMLAHTLASIGSKRVLVMDLDTQCNSSFAFVGSDRVREAFDGKNTLSDYMGKRIRGHAVSASGFIIENVGDIEANGGVIHLLPSSIDLDDNINDAIIETRQADPFNAMNFMVRELLETVAEDYDYVLLDCPPGLSPLVNAAVGLSHRTIIPFRPDYISQYAVDRMADKVQKTGRLGRARKQLADVPLTERKYVSLVNLYGATARENRILDDFDGTHPRLDIRMKRQGDVAEAFYWLDQRQSLEAKYGSACGQVLGLYQEITGWLSRA